MRIFDTAARHSSDAWETVCFHPDSSLMQALEKGRVEGTHGVENLHCELDTAFLSFCQQCQKKTVFCKLPWNGETRKVIMRFAVAPVIGGVEQHNRFCCQHQSRGVAQNACADAATAQQLTLLTHLCSRNVLFGLQSHGVCHINLGRLRMPLERSFPSQHTEFLWQSQLQIKSLQHSLCHTRGKSAHVAIGECKTSSQISRPNGLIPSKKRQQRKRTPSKAWKAHSGICQFLEGGSQLWLLHTSPIRLLFSKAALCF